VAAATETCADPFPEKAPPRNQRTGEGDIEPQLAVPFELAIRAVVGTVVGGGAILALPVLVDSRRSR
jgi:hypothetical protein